MCKHFKVAPYAVVTEFADALKTVGHLPAEYIPVWFDPRDPPESAPLGKRRPKATKKKLASLMPEDVEMMELESQGTPPAVDDEESPSESVVSTARRTKRAQAGPSESSSKREHQESPNRPPPAPKRARLTAAQADPEVLLDLSGYEFDEESKLNSKLIPQAAGAVSRSRLCSGARRG